MKTKEKDPSTIIRRKATEALLVYDTNTKLPFGQIADLSARGLKLTTEEPVVVNQVYYFRIPFDKKIGNSKELFFDAECRWCMQNEETGWYDSGYFLRFPSPKEAAAVKELTRIWMINQAERQNARHKRTTKKNKSLFRKIFGSGTK